MYRAQMGKENEPHACTSISISTAEYSFINHKGVDQILNRGPFQYPETVQHHSFPFTDMLPFLS